MEDEQTGADQESLEDAAVVIRMGLMDLADLRDSAQRCRTLRGFFGLSCYGENGLDSGELAELAKMGHAKMRKSVVGKLRTEGFEIGRSGRLPHLTIVFETQPTDGQLNRLIGVFDDPEPNPHPVQ